MISDRERASGRLAFFRIQHNAVYAPSAPDFASVSNGVNAVLLATKAVADTLPLSACASEPLLRVERASEVKRLPIVRSIVIKGEPVFDPSRETLGDQILNGMNRLHWQTRESVIQQQLLFAMGTRVSPSVLAESARLLRSRPYLMEASIKVRNPCESEVDVEVTTRDAWSSNAPVGTESFGRKQ